MRHVIVVLLYTVMEKIMTNTLSHGTNFVIALGDHALGASTQLINHLYRLRRFPNLTALTAVASENTHSWYNVW